MMQVLHKGLRALHVCPCRIISGGHGVGNQRNIVFRWARSYRVTFCRARSGCGCQREKNRVPTLGRILPHMFQHAFAVLRPTPGSDCSAARLLGTTPS